MNNVLVKDNLKLFLSTLVSSFQDIVEYEILSHTSTSTKMEPSVSDDKHKAMLLIFMAKNGDG